MGEVSSPKKDRRDGGIHLFPPILIYTRACGRDVHMHYVHIRSTNSVLPIRRVHYIPTITRASVYIYMWRVHTCNTMYTQYTRENIVVHTTHNTHTEYHRNSISMLFLV